MTPQYRRDLSNEILRELERNFASARTRAFPERGALYAVRPQINLTVVLTTVIAYVSDRRKIYKTPKRGGKKEALIVEQEIDRSPSFKKLNVMEYFGDRLAMIAVNAEALAKLGKRACHAGWPQEQKSFSPLQWNSLISCLTSNDFFDLVAIREGYLHRLKVDGHRFGDEMYASDMLEAYIGNLIYSEKSFQAVNSKARRLFAEVAKHPFFEELADFIQQFPEFIIHVDKISRDKNKFFHLTVSASGRRQREQEIVSLSVETRGEDVFDCFAKALNRLSLRVERHKRRHAVSNLHSIREENPHSKAIQSAVRQMKKISFAGVSIESPSEKTAFLSVFLPGSSRQFNCYFELGRKIFELYCAAKLKAETEKNGGEISAGDMRKSLDGELLPNSGNKLLHYFGRVENGTGFLKAVAGILNPSINARSINWKGMLFTLLGIKYMQQHQDNLDAALKFCAQLCEPGLFEASTGREQFKNISGASIAFNNDYSRDSRREHRQNSGRFGRDKKRR